MSSIESAKRKREDDGDADGDTRGSANPLAELGHFNEQLMKTVDPVAFEQIAAQVAEYLLKHTAIQVAKPGDGGGAVVSYLGLHEVELYINMPTVHADHYTHGDPQQELVGTWYFHKKGGTYKAGSFKGLDVTFGSKGVPCGALIRSVYLMPTKHSTPFAENTVEGPSLVVDKILELSGTDKIAALVGGAGPLPISHESLKLISRADMPHKVAPPTQAIRAPRVGLVPRKEADMAWAGKLYRFISYHEYATSWYRCAKQRGGVIAGLGVQIKSAKERSESLKRLQNLSGGTAANVKAVVGILNDIQTEKMSLESIAAELPGGVFGADVGKADVIARIVGYAMMKGKL